MREKNISKKIVAIALSALMLLSGVQIYSGINNEVKAAGATTNVESVLEVKAQVSTDKKIMRFISSIDSLNYSRVGFEVTYEGLTTPKVYETKTVYERIDSTTEGVEYEFGPKAVSSDAKYFVTAKMYVEAGVDYVVKAYAISADGTEKMYGATRCVNVEDGASDSDLNLSFASTATVPVGTELAVTYGESNTQTTATVVCSDGKTVCVRVDVDKTTLPSATKFTFSGAAAGSTIYRNLYATTSGTTPDTTWHSVYAAEGETEFVIITKGDMYGFQSLSKTINFGNQVIYLGADVDLNPGWVASLSSYSSATKWDPIGYWGGATGSKPFAGTFDGYMHSISGVCVRKWSHTLGLFGQVDGAVIKNFELKNSYFFTSPGSGKNGFTGSVVGILNGTLDNVKCDENVFVTSDATAQYNGGMVGKATNGTINNCWFAGTVSSTAAWSHTGGILGGLPASGEKCTITNSLFSGNIDYRANSGGIVGSAWTSSNVTIDQTLYAGNFVEVEGVSPYNVGTVLGNAKANAATVTNTYCGNETSVTKVIGSNDSSNSTASIFSLERTNLVGEAAYMNMNLDFYMQDFNEDGAWLATTNSHPVPVRFAGTATPLNMQTVTGSRTVWHNPTSEADTFVLYTPADFRGFQALSQTNSFSGDTVSLGADIDLNPGFDAKTYSTISSTGTAAGSSWEPIGKKAGNASVPSFQGTFDGKMHTIKGVFQRQWGSNYALGLFAQVDGATIKNFTLSNSYFYVSSSAGKTYLGSVVGMLNGRLENIKSDESVKIEVASAREYNGGLVGAVTKGTTAKSVISNSWYAGQINGSGSRQGGILGGMYESGSSCLVEHCLVTGEFQVTTQFGGLVGTAWTSTALEMTDCLFAGKIATAAGAAPTTSGTVLGDVSRITPTVSKVYTWKYDGEVLSGTVGNGSGKVASGSITRVSGDELVLRAAKENTQLSICDEADYGNANVVGKTKFWYISDKYPVLATFSEPVVDYALNVATYNIGYGRKNGEAQNMEVLVLEKMATHIRDNGIDVCFLQEVNGTQTTNVFEAQLDGYEIAYHQTDTSLLWGNIGIAIVSKYDIVDTQFVVIPNTNGDEARGLLKAMLDINGDGKADVATICTHFDGTSEDDSATGVVLLEEMVEEIYDATPNMPVIFGGDLNQAYNGDTNTIHIKEIANFLSSSTYGLTTMKTFYNESFPEGLQLDYIFKNHVVGQGAVEVQNPTMDENVSLSDHRPLVATLYVKAQ